jgi:hypothetical protein
VLLRFIVLGATSTMVVCPAERFLGARRWTLPGKLALILVPLPIANLPQPVPGVRECLERCGPTGLGLQLGGLAWRGPVPTFLGCAR